jgi:hypothetical protein
MWFNLATAREDVTASKYRDRLLQTMTNAQIAEAQAMARTCEASNYKQCY